MPSMSLEEYFIEEEYERGNFLQKVDIRARDFFLKKLVTLKYFQKGFHENKISNRI